MFNQNNEMLQGAGQSGSGLFSELAKRAQATMGQMGQPQGVPTFGMPGSNAGVMRPQPPMTAQFGYQGGGMMGNMMGKLSGMMGGAAQKPDMQY